MLRRKGVEILVTEYHDLLSLKIFSVSPCYVSIMYHISYMNIQII